MIRTWVVVAGKITEGKEELKEDFKEVKFEEFPSKLKLPTKKEYISKYLKNSQEVYRVEIKDEPCPASSSINGEMSYKLDYSPFGFLEER